MPLTGAASLAAVRPSALALSCESAERCQLSKNNRAQLDARIRNYPYKWILVKGVRRLFFGESTTIAASAIPTRGSGTREEEDADWSTASGPGGFARAPVVPRVGRIANPSYNMADCQSAVLQSRPKRPKVQNSCKDRQADRRPAPDNRQCETGPESAPWRSTERNPQDRQVLCSTSRFQLITPPLTSERS